MTATATARRSTSRKSPPSRTRPSRTSRARKRRSRRRKALAFIVIILVLALLGGSLWSMYFSTVLVTKRVKLVGTHELTPAQVSYWENALRKATTAPEWKADLEKNYWSDDFATSEPFRRELAADYAAMSAVMTELRLAKK